MCTFGLSDCRVKLGRLWGRVHSKKQLTAPLTEACIINQLPVCKNRRGHTPDQQTGYVRAQCSGNLAN